MKIQINHIVRREDDTPVVITDLHAGKNEVGQWVIGFKSENHKYFDYVGKSSGNYYYDEELEDWVNAPFWTQTYEFETFDTHMIDSYDDCWSKRNKEDSFMYFGPDYGHIGRFHWRNKDNRYDMFGRADFGEKPFEMANRKFAITLIPETEEESEEINGSEVDLALKWEYQILIVPFEQFYPVDKLSIIRPTES